MLHAVAPPRSWGSRWGEGGVSASADWSGPQQWRGQTSRMHASPASRRVLVSATRRGLAHRGVDGVSETLRLDVWEGLFDFEAGNRSDVRLLWKGPNDCSTGRQVSLKTPAGCVACARLWHCEWLWYRRVCMFVFMYVWAVAVAIGDGMRLDIAWLSAHAARSIYKLYMHSIRQRPVRTRC